MGPAEIGPLLRMPLRPGTLARWTLQEDSHRAQDASFHVQLILSRPTRRSREPQGAGHRVVLSLGWAEMAAPSSGRQRAPRPHPPALFP